MDPLKTTSGCANSQAGKDDNGPAAPRCHPAPAPPRTTLLQSTEKAERFERQPAQGFLNSSVHKNQLGGDLISKTDSDLVGLG